MIYLALGILSFCWMFLFDIFTLHNRKKIKIVFGLLGIGLFGYSTFNLLLGHQTIFMPFFVRILSGIFLIIFTFLLIYSLFLELPFSNTYGKEKHNSDLVDFGTYALCRHPGVLWFGFSFLFLFFFTGKQTVLFAFFLWTLADIIYVILQEKYIFKKMFARYCEYQTSTPMLLPTKKSIKKFINTIGRHYENTERNVEK